MKIVLILLFSLNLSFANDFKINSVRLKCYASKDCSKRFNVFSMLKRSYSSQDHFYNVFKLYVANEGVQELSFILTQSSDGADLEINLKGKIQIKEVLSTSFESGNEIELPSIIPIKKNDFYDEDKVRATKNLFLDIARDKGYPQAEVFVKKRKMKNGVSIQFFMDLKKPIEIKKIFILSKSNFLKELINKKMSYHKNTPLSLQEIRRELEELRSLFFHYGYYLTEMDLKIKSINKYSVNVYFEVKNTERYAFYVKEHAGVDYVKDKKFLAESLAGIKRQLSEENLKSIIEEKYKTLGYSFTNAQISIKKNIGRNGDINYYYYVDISVNKRVKFNELLFVGNNYFSNKELRDFFFTEASEQAASNILDQKYFSSFSALLKEKYIKAGFLSATIDKPVTFYDYSTEKMSVTFRIREGSKTKVESFKILGIPFDQEKLLKNKLTNKIGLGFNPIAFQDDLKLINNYLKDSGYYFSKILNTKSLGIVEYNSDDTMVKINIEVEAGPKIYVDDIIIIGNQKTRKKLILREVKLEPGALVTSSKIEHAQANLLALGIFSSVQIKPVTQNSTKTDILVFVREKDFGLVEFSPGLRTDLGFKVGANINYKNLDGMNKRVSFNSVINRRFDLTDLAEERKDSKSLIEFDSSLNFLEDKIFNSEFDLRLSLSKSRKRFYAYDVDLQRAAYTVSYDFTRWFNISFRQQIESVSQFNAIQDSNHGHFQIGSFTPALKIDLRNRSINPTSGAEFTLSSEYATPLFFSQSGSGSTINYYKLVNRNKFYIPVTDHSVVAISTSYGIQENYANNRNDNNEVEGYIPPIRVFRLSGSDIIRGFEDTEMNYLADEGKDISEVEITNRAYMVNFKLEPRFYLSDTTVFGVFYDAGRVFVNDFEADELRSSVGLSFKLVTPVGTLDFDYGIKTLRKRDSNGNLENPGKLHVSIGFF